ncbi:MAG TPA: hypothetical protein VF669_18300, partial [Tepidisphaeraceae bacterium]
IDRSTGKPTTVDAPIRAGRRAIVALLVAFTSIAALVYGATTKGDWPLVIAALGLIGIFIGLALLTQAALAYAGFIHRRR